MLLFQQKIEELKASLWKNISLKRGTFLDLR